MNHTLPFLSYLRVALSLNLLSTRLTRTFCGWCFPHVLPPQENQNNLSQMSQVSQIGNMAAQFKTGSKSVCQLVQCRGKHSCSTYSILHCRVLGSTMRAASY